MSNSTVSNAKGAIVAKAKEVAINAVPLLFAPDPPPPGLIQAKPVAPMLVVPGNLNPMGAALAATATVVSGEHAGCPEGSPPSEQTQLGATDGGKDAGGSGKGGAAAGAGEAGSQASEQDAVHRDSAPAPGSDVGTGQGVPEDNPSGQQCLPGDAIVVGIGGTSSGDPENADAHVEKIVRDYDTEDRNRLFIDGPDHVSPIGGVSQEMRDLEDEAYKHVRRRLEERPDLPVDLYGHSRGGYGTLQLSARLQGEGVNVRHLGLYDPVDMAVGYGGQECVPANVQNVSLVRARDDDQGGRDQSREIFRRPLATPCDIQSTTHVQYDSTASHAAIGGNPGTAPWNDSGGSFGTIDSESNEIAESRAADETVRRTARSSGAHIRSRDDYDTHSQNPTLERQCDSGDFEPVKPPPMSDFDRRNLERMNQGLRPIEK